MARQTMRRAGSYLEYGVEPKEGSTVWTLIYKNQESLKLTPVRGVIERRTNIDERGIGNTYFDIRLKDDRLIHTSISQVFDHKPRMAAFEDSFGTFHKWA